MKAGNKAFMVNKVADVGLILGTIILGVTLGSFDFADTSTLHRSSTTRPWGLLRSSEAHCSSSGLWARAPSSPSTYGSQMPWRARRRCPP